MSWASLFWNSFKRSQNAMALLDDERRILEVNGALLRTLGYRRSAVVGKKTWEFVVGGPQFTEREFRATIARGDYYGEAELKAADGGRVSVHYSAHPEAVTGRQLILFVALDAAHRGRFRRRSRRDGDRLTEREREVVNLVAMGHTGREIADELHISHDTVRTHVRNAQEKLGARSRAQLVAIALGQGYTAPLN